MSGLYSFFLFQFTARHRLVPSFPTRRSSDLSEGARTVSSASSGSAVSRIARTGPTALPPEMALALPGPPSFSLPRSEEHTSELQSLRHLVCRLLLEKKKWIGGYSTAAFRPVD